MLLRAYLLALFFAVIPLCSAGQTYVLDIGVEQYLPVPEVSVGYVDHAVWACESPCITFVGKEASGAIIKINSYFEKAVTVELLFVVKYVDNKGFTRQYTSIKYYNIQCKGTAPTIVPSVITMKVGETYQLTVSSVSSQSSIQWESWDPTVARVNESGLVTARKEGVGIIFATVPGISSPLTCTINVKNPKLTLNVNPTSSEIERGTNIFLTASKSNAVIYYTLDGSDPKLNGNQYSGQITIDANGEVTLKAIAYDADEGKEPSEVLIKTYYVIEPKLELTSNINSGTVDVGTSVHLASNVSDATIYYTTDGTNPSNSSFLYQGPILVVSDITINAIAMCPNYRNSDVLTLNYTVRRVSLSVSPSDNNPIPTGTKIVLSANPSDAEILYTTDGTDPYNLWGDL